MSILTILTCIVVGWTVKYVDKCTAITTIRLWNELYACKSIAHDFDAMMDPGLGGCFIAAIKHDEIKAIANCNSCDGKSEQASKVLYVAHAPGKADSAVALIDLLQEWDTVPDWSVLRNQPRWYLEEVYKRLEL